ncbi:hypothetical protein, partial [Sinorhizobium meliloti]|uniref:hypothetical protein n=1 Tax=Rhizobium meliloti TaxID=382 RepID=UPI001AECD799
IPFAIRDIACISARPPDIIAPGGFSPGHRDLHQIFANPTESQLAEITQFFLRQPLMDLT